MPVSIKKSKLYTRKRNNLGGHTRIVPRAMSLSQWFMNSKINVNPMLIVMEICRWTKDIFELDLLRSSGYTRNGVAAVVIFNPALYQCSGFPLRELLVCFYRVSSIPMINVTHNIIWVIVIVLYLILVRFHRSHVCHCIHNNKNKLNIMYILYKYIKKST